MADRRAQIEARLAAATPGPWLPDGPWWWESDEATTIITAGDALYRGPGTGAVIRSKEVMAERDELAAKLAAAGDGEDA